MADIELSDDDIDYISRVVATEIPPSVRRNPMEYNRMVGAVVDTVTNRLATGKYGKTVPDVLNQRRAFSKITGPARLAPYGSVQATPKASKRVEQAVKDHLAGRARGKKAEIKKSVDYANPNYSDFSNLRGWVNPMIAKGATKLGIGKAVHYHGTAPGGPTVPDYNVKVPSGFMPTLGDDMRRTVGAPIPAAKPQNTMMAQARAFDRGGILNPAQVSLNPVSSAQASEIEYSRQDVRPGQVTRSSLPQLTKANTPADNIERGKAVQGLYNRAGGIANDYRPMPSGPIQRQVPDRIRAMPTGIVSRAMAPQAVNPNLGPAYQDYARSRTLAPVAAQPAAPAQVEDISGPIDTAGAINVQRTSPVARAAPTFGQKGFGKNVAQDLGAAGVGALIGSAGGPVGSIIGGLIGREMMDKRQGQAGILSSLFGGGSSQFNGQRTNLGSGINAVAAAMGGRAGDTARYNSQGGGTVTNNGNGSFSRTSDRYGWTETTHPSGHTSISYSKPDKSTSSGSKKK